VSDNHDIHNYVATPQLIRSIKYCLASSPTEAKLHLFPDNDEQDECYALEVSQETIKSEITHCKELIAYWNTQPDENKQKKYNYLIIPSIKNQIKYYNDLLIKHHYDLLKNIQ
jgi:hypothetical protein